MKRNLYIVIAISTLFIAIQIASMILHDSLARFGVFPRRIDTLLHIYLAPFIHGGWQHLANNIIVFSLFSFLILEQGPRYYFKSSFFILTFSGVLVWLAARPAFHLGASGWIFGLFGLLIARAWYTKSFKNLLVALFIVVFYGGMITGILPGERYISFEYHLAGIISGVFFARLSRKRKQTR